MGEWIYLALAIAFDVAGTVNMKLSAGFTRSGPSVAMVLCFAAMFAFLALALRRLDVGTVYATWSGLGTATVAVIGIIFFHEPISLARVLLLAMIVIGVVGLNVVNTWR